MLVLGIDTSTPTVSVALVDDDKLLARRDQLANNAHGEVLAALIDAVLRAMATTPADLAAMAVGLGPGPFTGLRVGIVTAAAMGDALGIPVFGDCSLDVLGPEGLMAGRPFAAVTDARRRQVYWALYDDGGSRVEGPDIAPAVEVADHLRGRVRDVVGPGATQYADAFAGFDVAATQWPDAGRLAMNAARRHGSGSAADALTPMYLRRPDAREPGSPKKVTPA